MRSFLVNLAVLFAGIALALAIGEGLATILHPLSTVEYQIENDIGPILTPRQQTRWVNEDYDVQINTNSAGFHDVEHAIEKPAGVYRILVLGDSYIEALQLSIEEGFTQCLVRALGNWMNSKRVEVINMGISGLGPAQYYRILEQRGLAYNPDLVVMAVLPDNDFRDSLPSLSGALFKPYYSIRSDDTLEYIPPHVSALASNFRPLLRRSAFLHLIRQGITSGFVEKWFANLGILAPASGVSYGSAPVQIPADWYVYAADPPEPWPEAYRVTLRMIKESRDLAARGHAAFLVLIIASTQMIEDRWSESLKQYNGASSLKWDFRRPSRQITQLGERSIFDVIDLLEPFRQDFLANRQSHSWPHDGHWNPRGHRLAADIVSSYLFEQHAKYGLN